MSSLARVDLAACTLLVARDVLACLARAVFTAKPWRQLHQRIALGARFLPPHLLHRQLAAQLLNGFDGWICCKERLCLEPRFSRMPGLLLLHSSVESKAIGA